ncbi:hypothetical protein C1940_08775 [Lactiplantibacillus plantarum subsp. plantarum]|uniref:hypothetical protein n=1 Tax=Lactiplantibacillus plantarum TaxID=1590 RepID=UPI000CD364D1|nr:hypothetical protein [Lactiplantibacillus plantarum]AUV70949.1 hypothetical protein C1940_00015 [Lactiplantibacillus plantarum subsp. plantarum]AUV72176.1 hypothetical protein C1940_06720 [Lactiplantibacillus plantarum subsp. plantarum]AUV72556.1 hypothetical protein C1940_08775 [Lactiplantibacillus plantarum subsp. plantarum]
MAKMIRSKYGYEPPEWVQADARLDRWYKNKRRAKQHGAFSLEKNKKDGNYYEQSIVEKVKH